MSALQGLNAQNTGDTWMDDSEIGESKSSSWEDGIGENNLTVFASPGYPRCAKCHAQLEIGAEGDSTTTSCGCGEKASYEIPKTASRMMRSLRALVADEHRTDRKAVKDNSNASAIAVACPSCNAPLDVNESSKFITCTFCNTTSRIPDRTWFRISGKEPKTQPIWLLFQGKSARRIALEEGKEKEQRERKREEQRGRDRAEQKSGRQHAEEDKKKAEAERALAVEAADAEIDRVGKEQEKSGTRFAIAMVIGCIVVATAIALFVESSKTGKKTTKTDPDDDACSGGDGKACIRMGDKTGAKYPATRRKYYEQGCNYGAIEACTKYGDASEDPTTKAQFYERGCNGGDHPACDALDQLYASGKATPKDAVKAAFWAEKLCSSAKPASCTTAALAATDESKAFGLFHTACDGGDPRGCDELGHAYESGKGTKVDNAAMLLAYQTACNRDQKWCYDLGRVYDSGVGVQKNAAKALGLYTQACSAGSKAACAAVRK